MTTHRLRLVCIQAISADSEITITVTVLPNSAGCSELRSKQRGPTFAAEAEQTDKPDVHAPSL
jgi:hypothetical protein